MKNDFSLTSISPGRLVATFAAISAIWLLAPDIAHAAVAFGEIGQNVAANAKGVAKGVTVAGFAGGAGMGVWGCVEMYNALCSPHMAYIVYNNLL